MSNHKVSKELRMGWRYWSKRSNPKPSGNFHDHTGGWGWWVGCW